MPASWKSPLYVGCSATSSAASRVTVVRDGEQPPGCGGAGPDTAIGIAETRAPLDRRGQTALALDDRHAERQQIRGRDRDWNSFTACRPALSRYSNLSCVAERDRPFTRGRTADRYKAPFNVFETPVSSGTRRENGSGCAPPRSLAMSSTRLLRVVLILLQSPAFQPGASIREHGNEVRRFDADVAFARFAEQRRRRKTARARCGTTGAGLPAVSARRRLLRALSLPAAAASRSWRWREEERLVDVQNQEREKDRAGGRVFPSTLLGTGSCPPEHMGWHRTSLRRASQLPRTGPCRSTASLRVVGAGRDEPARARKVGRNKELVASEHARTPLVARDEPSAGLRSTPETPFDVVTVFALNGSQTGVEEFSLGDDDHVKPRRDLVTTENLSNESFSSISLDRSAQRLVAAIPRRPTGVCVGQREQCRQRP